MILIHTNFQKHCYIVSRSLNILSYIYHSTDDRHLGCFQCEAVMRSYEYSTICLLVIMKMHLLWMYTSQYNFWVIGYAFVQLQQILPYSYLSGYTNFHSPAGYKRCSFLISSPKIYLVFILFLAILMEIVYLIDVLICIL